MIAEAQKTVVRWRFEQLVAAGYDPQTARELAQRTDVDLREAERLLARGCPPAVALRILR